MPDVHRVVAADLTRPEALVHTLLATGPVSGRIVQAAYRTHGIGRLRWRTALRRLGAVPRRVGAGGWEWVLPPNAGKTLRALTAAAVVQAARLFDGPSSPGKAPTLRSYAPCFLSQPHLRLRSRESYEACLRLHLVPIIGAATRLDAITRATLDQFIRTRLAEGAHRNTVALDLYVLRALLMHAVERSVLTTFPIMRLARLLPSAPCGRTPAVEQALTADEARRLVVVLRRGRCPSFSALVLVALKTGCRMGELLGMTWAQIDFTHRRLLVSHSLDERRRLGTPKSGKTRTLPLSADTIDVLRALEVRRDPAMKWVFVSSRNQPFVRCWVRKRLRDACDEAGLTPRTFHALRATFGTLLAARGADPFAIKDLLGHGSVQMTEQYVRAVREHHGLVDGLDEGKMEDPRPASVPPSRDQAPPVPSTPGPDFQPWS